MYFLRLSQSDVVFAVLLPLALGCVIEGSYSSKVVKRLDTYDGENNSLCWASKPIGNRFMYSRLIVEIRLCLF